MDRVVGGKFKLGRKLGSGSFGEIFLGLFDSSLLPCFVFTCFSSNLLFFLLLNEFCILVQG